MTTLSPAQRRALLAGSIGHAVERVDWAVYSAFAPIFAGQFFPSGDPTAALLSTLAVFADGFIILVWPAFHFLQNSFAVLLLIELAGIVLLVGYSANCAVVMAEQFPPEVRSVGIGLPYALAVAIFGGTAPYISTWLTSSGHLDLVWLYAAAAPAAWHSPERAPR
jgi:hypothetical protein